MHLLTAAALVGAYVPNGSILSDAAHAADLAASLPAVVATVGKLLVVASALALPLLVFFGRADDVLDFFEAICESFLRMVDAVKCRAGFHAWGSACDVGVHTHLETCYACGALRHPLAVRA